MKPLHVRPEADADLDGLTEYYAAIAGSEMRHAMGVAVFAGMIGVTAFGLFLTPVFYVLLRAMTGNRPLVQHVDTPASATAGGH